MLELVKKVELPQLDLERIKNEAFKILEKHDLPQIGLTHSINATEENKLTESTGSILDRQTRTIKFKETDFTEFNDAYKGSYLHEVYQMLPNIGRFRIMAMSGPMCYTFHRDFTRRYHIAVETNINCLFLFPQLSQQFHLPADSNMYLVDTRQQHTFVNGSRSRRVHLVLDDLSTIKRS